STVAEATAYEQGDPRRHAVQPYAQWLISYQKGARLPGPVLGVVLLTGLAGLLRFGRRDERRWNILLLWGIAVSLLAIPPLTAQFDYRYVLPAVPFACTPACLAVGGPTRRPAPGPPAPTPPPP